MHAIDAGGAVPVAFAVLLWSGSLSAQKQSRVLFAEFAGSPDVLAAGLKPTDLELTIGRVTHTIVRVAPGSARMRVAVLVDTSATAESMVNDLRAALVGLADALPQPHEIALVTIGSQPRIIQAATVDRDQMKKSMSGIFASGGSVRLEVKAFAER